MHRIKRSVSFLIFAVLLFTVPLVGRPAEHLRVATFQVDATPPLGSPLCTGALPPARLVVAPLSARGLALLGAGKPIVLVAVDWGLIANEGMDEWRETLAKAAGTTFDRVSVHELNIHDAPGYDPTTERILNDLGLGGQIYDAAFAHQTIVRAADALRVALQKPVTVTSIGLGQGKVEQVASNTWVTGQDGKPLFRSGAWRTPAQRDAPEGKIDPYVRLVSLWNGNQPLLALTFYASKSEAFMGNGLVDVGFVGLARAAREAAQPGVAQIYFDGAGANVTPGKYNDGSAGMQAILGQRLAAGMEAAWNAQTKVSLNPSEVDWRQVTVGLPLGDRLSNKDRVLQELHDPSVQFVARSRVARDLAWIELCEKGRRISLQALRLGPAYLVFSEGELFVEYQLATEAMKPGRFVAMAAYGGSGVGVVCTKDAYSAGVPEAIFSRTSGGAEEVVMAAIRALLERP